jgi:hypothetical protein
MKLHYIISNYVLNKEKTLTLDTDFLISFLFLMHLLSVHDNTVYIYIYFFFFEVLVLKCIFKV